MSKHISTRRESRNGVSLARTARLPSGSLPLRKTWPISLCIGLAIGSIAVSADALAGGPTGGTVVGGNGSITQAGNETVINQISQKLALNWETFNLKANESVLFNQPGRSAVALNRILDQNPSQIFGKINSNGQVFLINTHGIIFGATAQMNVGGLMASTLDLTPKDFLAGNYSLNAVGAGAGIVNHGLIQAASGGSVALVGGSVTNNGVILANYGSINLDGAEHAVLDFDGNGLINIQITGELKQRLDAKEAAVSNTGTLQAEGGTVVLQASAAKDLFTNLVNNSGVIDASGISTDGGVVRLVGTGGNTVNSGSINASGVHGGKIQVLSDKDVLVTGGALDASGSQGGGAIRVGGGIRGGEGLAVAERTYVAGDVVLNADATGRGHGGGIAVFSRDNSVIAGSLSARGGVDGGNGGFIETSSHGALTVTGTPQVMARATGGSGGNWLIDPNDITIVAGNGHTKINNSSPFVSSNDGASLGVDLITAALTGSGTNVTITTGTGGTNAQLGNITLNADLDYNGKGTNTLTLDAAHDIIINNKIFDSTPGGDVLNLTLLAGNSISLNNDISLGTGSATLTATAGSISQAAGKLLSGGDLTLNAATGIGASGAIETSVDTLTFTNSGAGGVAVNDADAVTVSGSTVSGDVNVSARTGDLTLGGDVSSADNVTLGAGAGNVVHSSGTVSGNIVHFNAWGTNGSIGASDAVLTKASQLSFEAKGTGVVNITEADGAAVSGTAVSGNVAITSTTGDLAINGNISTTGDVNLNAVAGSISRTAGGISGNALTLTAGGTNGAIGALDAIRTDVSSIVFGANGTGAVNITEANGATVSGTAGSGSVGITSTTSDLGVAAPGITTSGGDVTLTAAGSGARINIAAGAAVDTTNGAAAGANVSLVADNADIFGTINAGTGGVVTIRQATAGRPIALGGTLPTNLDLSDAELNSITANTIVIGDANSGAISIVGTISPGSANKLSLNSGSTISQTTGSIITVGTLSGASAGATTLGEANQITNLGTFSAASLLIHNAGPLTLLGNVTTTGAQTYDAALLLGADRVLSGTDITFNSTVDGAHALTANASGITTFGAAVGGTTALTSLTTDAPGSTTLSGNVTTSGTQTWGDTVTLGSNATLTGTTVSLAAVTGGSNNLTVTGNAVLSGAVAGVSALQISGTTNLDTASVSTSGGQTYSGAVTLGANATLASSGGGVIGFGSTVNGAHTLTVNTGGAASFGGAVGGATALTGLTTSSGTFSSGDLTVNGPLSVTTTVGGITQVAGVYAVNGTSTFNAGSNAITLTSLNNFGSAVNLTGGTTQIYAVNALTLGTLQTGSLTVGSGAALNLGHGTVAGNLSATSGTSITLNGALVGPGNVAFSGSAPGGTGSIAGTGSITGVSGSPFALAGPNVGTSGGITFNGFVSADATTVTGAAGFDDVSKLSLGMTFANATSVGGSGTIANVAGSFADNSGVSSASGIAYSGFGAVTGTGGSVTGVTGSFDLGTKTSAASGINYGGFNVTTLSGSGTGATIAGGGQTYTLDNTIANQGSSGGVAWTGFGNIADTGGTVLFGTGGSLSGNVTAATLNYGSYGSAVTFDLAHGSGATTGIGGTWSNVSTVTGNGSGAITGSSTFALSGANAGSAGGIAFTGFTTADATTITGAQGFDSTAKSSLGMTFANATNVAGSGAITNLGSTAFNLTGTTAGNAGGVGYSGFSSADTTTVTGAAGFDDVSKLSQGMTFANATSVSGSGTIANVGGGFADNTGLSSASNIIYSGFGAVTGTGGNVTGVTGSFDLGTKTSAASGINYGGFNVTTLSGSGAGATIAGTNQTYTLDNTVANQGSSGGVAWTGFGNLTDTGGTVLFGTGGGLSGNVTAAALNYGSYGSAVTFDLADGSGATTGIGGTWAGVAMVTGNGNAAIMGSSTFALSGANAGTAGGVNFAGFTAADAATVTGAVGFDSTAKSSLGMTFANATSVTGSGAITNLGSTAFNLTGTTAGNAGGVGYSGFSSADTTTVTGAAGFDDVSKLSRGVTFANATSVSGSGTIANVGGGFADNTGLSSASNIIYSGFGAVTGTGGNVTGVTGSFDLGTKTSAASGINYGGFNVTTLSGSGAGATIAGTNQTYHLTGANAGNNGTLSWTSFGNLSDSGAGTFVFANGAGVSGMLTSVGAGTLDYSAYTTAVNVGLAGTATNTGGWSGITTVTGGSASDTISGSNQTYHLTGLNTGNNGTVTWSSFENVQDAGTGTLSAANQTWGLTGHNQGTVTNLAGTFSGIGNLIDTGTGHFLMHVGADGDISGNLDGGSDGSLDYTGYTTPVAVNLSGTGTTGVGGTASGIAAITASSNLDVQGNVGGMLTITTTGAGTTTTLGATTVGGDLNITASGDVLQTGGALNVAGVSTIDAGTSAITLAGGSNDFVGTVNLVGGTTQINDINALTLGAVNTGALTVNAGDLAINGALTSTTANLHSTGAINEGAGGVITAGTLTGSSAGATALNGANHIGTLGSFTAAGFNLTNAQALAVTGPVNGGASTTLTTTAGDLTINGAVSGTMTTLTSAGALSEGAGGTITAGTLTGSSTGATTLNGANHIGTLGSFAAATFALTNAQALAVTGPVDGGASTTLTTTAGDLAINGAVNGTVTTLTSAGAISEGAGGVITAGTLSGSSVGATTLDGANHIGTLGSFTAASFALTNAQALAVTGPVNGGASTTLKTTVGDLAINGAVSGTATTLTSAGAISEGASGVITAGTLTGSSAGATALNGANQVGALGAFTTGGDFAFNNAQSLTVSNAPSANGGASNLTLTATGAGSDLILASTLTGNTVTLAAGRSINQTAGAIIATTLTGSSTGSTTLNGANHIGTLGGFTAAGFNLTNAQALAVAGPVDGGVSTTLKTTAGDLAINGAVSGTTTTLTSAGAINEGAGGVITAGTLTGSSTGATTLNGDNKVGTLGSFTASNFALTNAQTLAVTGPVDGGASTALKTTTGDLAINGAVSGTTTTLTSAGAISEGTGGTMTAGTLTGSSAGATTLNGSNHIGTLGSFTAASFALTNAQALAVTGPVSGGASTTLKTTAGDLAINGAVSGTTTTLTSAGAISEGVGGVITAGTLSGSAVGPTVLGSATTPNKNMVDTLGNFTSLAGFSMTNDKTLTLASVAGSSFTVNAGTSPFYLSVTHGDLFQLGTAPVYDGVGVWGSTGRMGTGSLPIYVVGTGLQNIANVGLPPAYFYAVDSAGNLLPLGGGFALNVPTASGAGSAQNGNHGDSYIDPSVITANYRSYGIVPSGVRLPPDQQSGCDPDQPDQAACQDPDALGMVMPWPKAPR